jgi:hypothetical protein
LNRGTLNNPRKYQDRSDSMCAFFALYLRTT